MAQILEQIKSALSSAVKKGDSQAVSALRYVLANLHNEEIAKQRELSDEEVVVVLRRQVKKHQESIEAFKNGSRLDLAHKEEQEKSVLEKFLPAQLGEEEIRKLVKEVTVLGVRDFGQVMGQVMGELKGQADGAEVAKIVKEELGWSMS